VRFGAPEASIFKRSTNRRKPIRACAFSGQVGGGD